MKRFGNNNDVFCFFCGSTAGKDRKLITGPSGNTFICDKCVAICQGILDQQEADETCATCGSRLTCNGCSNCGACES